VPLETSILRAAADLLSSGAREFHGFEIARHVAGVADRRRLTAYGTLYRALGRLEHMGLLESRWEDPQLAADDGRPVRRLYALTAGGALAVREPGRRPARGMRSPRRRKVAPA